MKKYLTKDFVADNLPSTRKQVFFDRLKLHFGKLLKLGLICFSVALPLFVISLLKDMGIASVYAEYESGNITLEQAQIYVVSSQNMYSLFSIVGYLILSVGVSGCMQVIKRLAWIEPVFLRQDFNDGIKFNCRGYLGIFALFGIFMFFAHLSLNYFDNFIVSVLPIGVLLVAFLPTALLMLSQNCIYNVTFGENLRNSFALYLKTVPTTLLSVTVMALPTLFFIIPNIIVKYLLLAVSVIFLLPLAMLFWFLYSCYLFDKNINCKQFPELLNKGLHLSQKDVTNYR